MNKNKKAYAVYIDDKYVLRGTKCNTVLGFNSLDSCEVFLINILNTNGYAINTVERLSIINKGGRKPEDPRFQFKVICTRASSSTTEFTFPVYDVTHDDAKYPYVRDARVHENVTPVKMDTFLATPIRFAYTVEVIDSPYPGIHDIGTAYYFTSLALAASKLREMIGSVYGARPLAILWNEDINFVSSTSDSGDFLIIDEGNSLAFACRWKKVYFHSKDDAIVMDDNGAIWNVKPLDEYAPLYGSELMAQANTNPYDCVTAMYIGNIYSGIMDSAPMFTSVDAAVSFYKKLLHYEYPEIDFEVNDDATDGNRPTQISFINPADRTISIDIRLFWPYKRWIGENSLICINERGSACKVYITEEEISLPDFDTSKIEKGNLPCFSTSKISYFNASINDWESDHGECFYMSNEVDVINYFTKVIADAKNASTMRFSARIKTSANANPKGSIKIMDKYTRDTYLITTTKVESDEDSCILFGSKLKPILMERDPDVTGEASRSTDDFMKVNIEYIPTKSRSMGNFSMNKYRIMPQVIAKCINTGDRSIFDYGDMFHFTTINGMQMEIASNLKERFKLKDMGGIGVKIEGNACRFVVTTDNKKYIFTFQYRYANHFGIPL
ncbi:hypothetical protein [uncultured Duncaniella sp.]|uniref:hypothetical protein n=1 Tax=uncultured Duncaniella sp. TaxID=2768039 RepID=UPI002626EF65|nr:hypothetical protein [uncultured Duncaniella sp.]